MIYLALACFAALLWFSHRYRWWAPTVDYRRPRILMYHMVRDHVPGARFNGLRVPPAEFERQLAWLEANGWTFMTLGELMTREPPPAKSVVITFDDGYADNLTQALPIMRRHGAKGTLFLVADREGNDWSVRKKAHHDSGELAREPKLSDGQVRELLASGLFELGAHTFTHPPLPELEDRDREHEVIGVKGYLEARYGVPVTSFAYPFGIYGEKDVRLAERAGYAAAVTTESGIDEDFRDRRLELKRVKIGGKEGMFAFRTRLRTGMRGLNK